MKIINLDDKVKGTVYSILLYIVVMLGASLLGFIIAGNKELMSNINKVYIISSILPIIAFLLIYIFSKNMNLGLKDLGITKKNFFKSLLVGIVISVILFFLLKSDQQVDEIVYLFFNKPITFICMFLYYLITISSFEEITYRGFIGHFLYGDKKKVSYLWAGVMFSLSHIPFQCIINNVNVFTFIEFKFGALVFFAIMHIFFQKIYDRYDNCIAPIIIHFTIDFFTLLK